jgi:hypothetical protein
MLIVRAVQIKNDKGIADYKAVVLVNERVIWRGIVIGHSRDNGWKALLRMIVNQAEREELNERDNQPPAISR